MCSAISVKPLHAEPRCNERRTEDNKNTGLYKEEGCVRLQDLFAHSKKLLEKVLIPKIQSHSFSSERSSFILKALTFLIFKVSRVLFSFKAIQQKAFSPRVSVCDS